MLSADSLAVSRSMSSISMKGRDRVRFRPAHLLLVTEAAAEHHHRDAADHEDRGRSNRRPGTSALSPPVTPTMPTSRPTTRTPTTMQLLRLAFGRRKTPRPSQDNVLRLNRGCALGRRACKTLFHFGTANLQGSSRLGKGVMAHQRIGARKGGARRQAPQRHPGAGLGWEVNPSAERASSRALSTLETRHRVAAQRP